MRQAFYLRHGMDYSEYYRNVYRAFVATSRPSEAAKLTHMATRLICYNRQIKLA